MSLLMAGTFIHFWAELKRAFNVKGSPGGDKLIVFSFIESFFMLDRWRFSEAHRSLSAGRHRTDTSPDQ